MKDEEDKKENFEVGVLQAHKSQSDWKEGHDADMLMDAMIAEWCANDPCAAQKMLNKNQPNYSVEFLADNLPAVQFVGQFYLELIVHGGLIAKDPYNQRKLDTWLAAENPYGQTNGNVIREALLSSIIYGYSGLRNILGNLVYVAPNQFRIWRIPALANGKPIPGVKAPVLYEIREKKDKSLEEKEKQKNIYALEDGSAYTLKEVIKQNKYLKAVDGSYYQDDGQEGAMATSVFIPRYNFCHLRHSDEGSYGRSPLTTDRLRTTLLIDYLRNVIDEVNNDGNDYLMYLKQRGVVGSSLASSMSKEAIDKTITAAQDPKTVKSVRERQLAAATTLAKKLKRTAKTRIGIVSRDWVDEINKLEGTVHLDQYQALFDDAKGVVADIYGIPAMLAGSSGGGWSTGMSALIPFTLERTIKPFQQRYAQQLSAFINRASGVNGEITFKEIDWGDEQTREEIEKIRSEIELNRAKARNLAVSDEKTAKETRLMTKKSVNGDNNNSANTKPAQK